MKLLLVGIMAILGGIIFGAQSVGAASLTIEPLQYNVQLKVGERQKGFVDITNPGAESVIVTTSVQAFRQIDNKGSLQFYTSGAVSEGILPDLHEFELGPRETIRLFFIVDGTKLPSGDVFAALFATIKPPSISGASSSRQTVRVGTILSIVNGTPGAREAKVTGLSLGFWQFDTKITGTYTVKNTADPAKTTGFYPDVKVGVAPWQQTVEAPSKLVYAGRSRDNSFQLTTARFGLYKVTAQFGSSHTSTWVFIASGVWRWVALGVLAASLAGGWSFYRHRRPKHRRRLRRTI